MRRVLATSSHLAIGCSVPPVRLLLLVLLLTACAPKQGLRSPGTTRHVGSRPPPELNPPQEGPWGQPDSALALADAPPVRRPVRRDERSPTAETVVAAAETSLRRAWRTVDGTTYRDDCSGLVCALYANADIDLGHRNTAALFELAQDLDVHHRKRVPDPGDVVFFDNTHDRNDNGRLDDDLTHLAVVEAVAADGTLTLVHRGSKGVVRIWMNLKRPDEHTDSDGRILNSYLRVRTSRDPAGTRYLAGELWRGSASFWSAANLVADAG